MNPIREVGLVIADGLIALKGGRKGRHPADPCPDCGRRLTTFVDGPYCFACGFGTFPDHLIHLGARPPGRLRRLWALSFVKHKT